MLTSTLRRYLFILLFFSSIGVTGCQLTYPVRFEVTNKWQEREVDTGYTYSFTRDSIRYIPDDMLKDIRNHLKRANFRFVKITENPTYMIDITYQNSDFNHRSHCYRPTITTTHKISRVNPNTGVKEEFDVTSETEGERSCYPISDKKHIFYLNIWNVSNCQPTDLESCRYAYGVKVFAFEEHNIYSNKTQIIYKSLIKALFHEFPSRSRKNEGLTFFRLELL